ncbi:MAG TPA: hypothetical protein VE548_16000 [Nitrososphaeraceae archaeon]|jgi:hypothetical protein|nr:hypothetical protein [Nitrososphaeraceae archaeon]
MTSDVPLYSETDYTIIANNIYYRLCILDKEDIEAGLEPAWHDLKELMNEMDGYSNKTDVWYLADYILHDERKFIDRNKLDFTVRLTPRGREHCDQKI